MNRAEPIEIIGNGENSGVEFKLDNIRPEQLAKEVVAFANFRGGRILIGVADDGTIHGVERKKPRSMGHGHRFRALCAPHDSSVLRRGSTG